jgi:hypothetical protein
LPGSSAAAMLCVVCVVCVCVCVICVYVCIYVCMWVCECAGVFVYGCIYMLYIYIYIYNMYIAWRQFARPESGERRGQRNGEAGCPV